MSALIKEVSSMRGRLAEAELRERSTAVVARYTTAAGQSIPNNTATIVNFGTMSIDTHNCVTTGAGWVFTAPIDGFYTVKSGILYTTTTAWADGEVASLRIYKNGSWYVELDRKDDTNSAATSMYVRLFGADDIQLAAGDTMNIQTIQQSGGALALFNVAFNNWVSISLIN